MNCVYRAVFDMLSWACTSCVAVKQGLILFLLNAVLSLPSHQAVWLHTKDVGG